MEPPIFSTKNNLTEKHCFILSFWAWFLILLVSLLFDRSLALWMAEHRWAPLIEFMVFLTDYGMLFALILFAVALFEKHLFRQLILVGLAFAISLETSYVLKQLFMTPRLYETWDIIPLKFAEGFSFPSMHTAFIFSALPFFKSRELQRWWWIWFWLALLVAFSRIFVGAHYVSDVVAGAGIGYGIGLLLWRLEEKYGLTKWAYYHLKDRFEVRRQVAHAVIGISIAALYYLNLISVGMVFMVLVIGGVFSVISTRWRLFGVARILDYFERPDDRWNFPGRGCFFMVLGCLLAMLLFEKNIALAAILIMALGDSVTNLFGRYFGEIKLPYNSKKTVDGALVGVFAATMGAFFFVPLHVALVASFAAIFVETLDLKLGVIELDDNVLVPLVAGASMFLLI